MYHSKAKQELRGVVREFRRDSKRGYKYVPVVTSDRLLEFPLSIDWVTERWREISKQKEGEIDAETGDLQ